MTAMLTQIAGTTLTVCLIVGALAEATKKIAEAVKAAKEANAVGATVRKPNIPKNQVARPRPNLNLPKMATSR